MTTKDKLLSLLESNKGEYLSGEEIAQTLNVSRNTIWKTINTLREAGYEIDAISNKGYCLSETTDILSPQGILKYLNEDYHFLEIEVLDEVESTNTLLRAYANQGAKEGTVLIANAQSNGRGRQGREFYSPQDTGVYLSLLLRPQAMKPTQAANFTTMAAVAGTQAIELVSQKETSIKWVNDLYVNYKKVSGILTEAAIVLENGNLDYVVLGIGMNAYAPKSGFPEDIQDIAGPIFTEFVVDGKNRLAAEFLNHFLAIYYHDHESNYVDTYRNKCFIIGQDILVHSVDGIKPAKALSLDDACHLLVQYEDGSLETLSSGEISIKVGESNENK